MENEDRPPEWYYQTAMAGGTGGDPGQTAQAIIDLTPGDWIAWAGYPGSAASSGRADGNRRGGGHTRRWG